MQSLRPNRLSTPLLFMSCALLMSACGARTVSTPVAKDFGTPPSDSAEDRTAAETSQKHVPSKHTEPVTDSKKVASSNRESVPSTPKSLRDESNHLVKPNQGAGGAGDQSGQDTSPKAKMEEQPSSSSPPEAKPVSRDCHYNTYEWHVGRRKAVGHRRVRNSAPNSQMKKGTLKIFDVPCVKRISRP